MWSNYGIALRWLGRLRAALACQLHTNEVGPDRASTLVENARAVLAANHGAIDRNLSVVLDTFGHADPAGQETPR